MGPSVRVTSGTGFELLVRAVAVADPHWRSVLTDGDEVHREARRAGGTLTRDAARFGRFGWINLLGPLADTPGSRQDLLDLVRRLEPTELHRILVGGRRAQLQRLVPAAVLDGALQGEVSAARALRRALRSDRTTLEVAPWLLRTRAREVKAACLRVLTGLPDHGGMGPMHDAAAALLARSDPAGLLERVAPGFCHDDEAPANVVLIGSPAVHPVVVVVDEPGSTLIAHPPLVDGEPADATERLRLLARAAGDHTRIRILQELRPGPRTLPDISRALDSPRTTLLHHLALLRAAGLVDVSISDAEPNVYRLNSDGFDEFARSVRAFTIQ
jgi:DNA-binding transcriptional ArsR family regulator